MPAPQNVTSPASSATAQLQPRQVGLPAHEPTVQQLSQMLENIVNALRETATISMNPRLPESLITELNAHSVMLLKNAAIQATRIDTFAQSGIGAQAIHHDLTQLGSQTQGYVQATLDALVGIGEGVQMAGLAGTGAATPAAPLTPEEREARDNRRMWVLFGVGATVVVTGLGIFALSKFGPASTSKPRFNGVLPAR